MALFKTGDFVEHNGEIGIIGWTENGAMNIGAEDGYVGIDLLTGNRGFVSAVKIEDVKKSSLNELVKLYVNEVNQLKEQLQEAKAWEFNAKKLKEQNQLFKDLLKTFL